MSDRVSHQTVKEWLRLVSGTDVKVRIMHLDEHTVLVSSKESHLYRLLAYNPTEEVEISSFVEIKRYIVEPMMVQLMLEKTLYMAQCHNTECNECSLSRF